MNVYGYIRVSATDQNEDRQLDAMKKTGITDPSAKKLPLHKGAFGVSYFIHPNISVPQCRRGYRG